MKLLKGQTETIEQDGVKIVTKVVDTATQAVISDLSMSETIEGRVRMIGYMLRNVIESVSINGTNYAPLDLATKADISDNDTFSALLNIGTMALGAIFPSGEDKKK